MQHRQIVFTTLLPTNQYPPETIQPTVRSLHHPTPSAKSRLLPQRLRLFPTRSDMQRVMKFMGDCRHFVTDITGVQTQMLPMISPHLRSFDRYAPQCRFHQSAVMPIRSRHFNAKRNPVTVGQQAAFGADFFAIRRIVADFFPHPAVPSSSRRPLPATSRRFLFSCRIQSIRSSTIVETNPPRSIPEIASGRSSRNKFPSRRGLSIGSRCMRRREWR